MYLFIKPRYLGAGYFEVEEFEDLSKISEFVLEHGLPHGAMVAQRVGVTLRVTPFAGECACNQCDKPMSIGSGEGYNGLCQSCHDAQVSKAEGVRELEGRVDAEYVDPEMDSQAVS